MYVYCVESFAHIESAADVLGMSVVHGMREVGGVCEMCMCLARGGVGRDGGEWMRGLGLGFTNPVGTWQVLDVCRLYVFGVRWYMWGVDRVLDQGLFLLYAFRDL